MTLHLVTTIPQVDGSTRYILLMTSARVAREWCSEIRNDPAMIDGWSPDYAINRYPGGRLTADIFPGKHMTAAEWRAVRAAIA